jgi:hypothetical protein
MASVANKFTSASKVAIVLVHLGKNPSPTLIPAAKYAQETHPNSQLILITDDPKRWSEFPGLVINTSKKRIIQGDHIARRARYIRKIAGGYWIKTYERIFVLKELLGNIDEDTMIVHIESDVMLQDSYIFYQALSKLTLMEIAVPRMSEELGVASILISKNIRNLLKGLTKLENLAKSYPERCTSDMKLLGLALNRNVISELPTWPEQVQKNREENAFFLFDGAAIGQYLFGQDPIHTGNRRISGFENPNFQIKPSELNWKIDGNSIYAEANAKKYYFSNLHIHSKEILMTPRNDPDRWARVMDEGNLQIDRVQSEIVAELIHSRGYSIMVKIEIFLRIGIKTHLAKILHRKD